MKDFLIGLAVGALGAYVAIKLSEEETRNKLRSELDYGLTVGRSKALRAGVIARQNINKGKEVVEQTANEMAEKLSDGLAGLSEKTRPAKS